MKAKKDRDETILYQETNEARSIYQFTSFVAIQLWRANQYENACFGRCPPWSFRHVRPYYYKLQCRPGFFCIDLFRHETFRPCSTVLRCAPYAGLQWSLVGVDTKRFEAIQETLHPLFTLPSPRKPRFPSVLRTWRFSAVSCPPCVQQLPRTGYSSCAQPP